MVGEGHAREGRGGGRHSGGCVREGLSVSLFPHSPAPLSYPQLGVLCPEPYATQQLWTGQVGYMVANIKQLKAARVGDTLQHTGKPVTRLPGFKPAKAMVYAGLFPVDGGDFEALAVVRKMEGEGGGGMQGGSGSGRGPGVSMQGLVVGCLCEQGSVSEALGLHAHVTS